MEVVFPRCVGLDVHKKTVVACVCSRARAARFRRPWRPSAPPPPISLPSKLGSRRAVSPMSPWNPRRATGSPSCATRRLTCERPAVTTRLDDFQSNGTLGITKIMRVIIKGKTSGHRFRLDDLSGI